ncbi:RNA polymerase sigma factor [Confluentibacter sediminis]|uniref:RNA polymerase sigma factor n=1 Tax=Confluentibacter sediminis TaxID=2219045 RepID=UPI000DAEA6A1|nr:RNA polymerase sigma-70 factor [Confluentibacter sediminis]
MMPNVEHNEKLLLQQLIDGDEKAFLAILKKYKTDVYAYSLSILKVEVYAEEIVQDVFLKIWEKREGVNLSQSFHAYVMVITKNMSLTFLKRALRDEKMKEQIFYQSQNAYSSIERKLREKELDQIYSKALDLLPPRRRQIFEMSREEGKSHKIISEELGISENTIKSQMNKALETIRTFIIEHGDISLSLLILALERAG